MSVILEKIEYDKIAIWRSRRVCSYLRKINEMATKFFNVITSQDETASLLLYGPVGDEQKVDPAQVVSELMELARTYRKIDIRINSVGGEVFAGIAIYNALKSSKADISIYIDGVAASIAAVIALCGKPLYMSRHARLMLHRVQGGEYGTAKQLRDAAQMIEELEGSLAKMIADRCRTTPESVAERYFDGKDHWLSAKEALDMGLVDGIYDIDDADVPDSASNDDIYQFFTNRLANSGRTQKQDKNMAFIDDLRARPSFKDATTEEQLMHEIVNLENSAAKVSALEGKVAELSAQLAETRKAGHTALLNQAVSEGKITQAQMPTFMSLLESDETNTKALLATMTPKASAKEFIHQGKGGAGSDLLSMSWDEIDKAGRLAELKNQYPEAYRQKFEETFNR